MPVFFERSHREYRVLRLDATGFRPVLPVIITDEGILKDFAHYMYLNGRKSRSWQDSATFAVQLLLEYVEANHQFFDSPQMLFRSFSNSLYSGTVERGCDPSELWWEPRQPDDASKIISAITQFSDWLAALNEDSGLVLNTWRKANRAEEKLNWAAYVHRKNNAFLSHLWIKPPDFSMSREVRSTSMIGFDLEPAKDFPEESIDAFLAQGFKLRKNVYNIRDILITMLMHYGGLRLSEALSLWCDDVTVEKGEVVVRIYHPQLGLAPGKKRMKRQAFLRDKYGLIPRNLLVKSQDSLFLGAKGRAFTDRQRMSFEVFFHPAFKAEVFAKLWSEYHCMHRVKPALGQEHPYAFTNKLGQPYSHTAYRKAHRAAVKRIGLISEKMLGTTPHGHRHSYGQRLAADGATDLTIKSAMHHSSIESSGVYTQPKSTQVRATLAALESKMAYKYLDADSGD